MSDFCEFLDKSFQSLSALVPFVEQIWAISLHNSIPLYASDGEDYTVKSLNLQTWTF